MCTENKTEVGAEMIETQAEAEEVVHAGPVGEEQAVSEVSDEAGDPAIIIFPDEEEEPEAKEAYVPKAVEYRQTKGIKEDANKPKTEKKIEIEKSFLKRKRVRDIIAYMFERPLFNVPAWLVLGCMLASAVLIDAYVFMGDLMYCVGMAPRMSDESVVVVILGVVVHMFMVILTFVGMRITVVSARNNGGNMTTAGLSMVRVAVVLMLSALTFVTLVVADIRAAIIFAVCTLFLVMLIISINTVRNSIIDGEPKRLSLICAVLCICFSVLNGYSLAMLLLDGFTADKESLLQLTAYVFSTISMLIFGIFIIAYNLKMKKLRKEIEAE